jgi:hypothetical protein
MVIAQTRYQTAPLHYRKNRRLERISGFKKKQFAIQDFQEEVPRGRRIKASKVEVLMCAWFPMCA